MWVLSVLFLVVFLGNTVTTSMVIPQKTWAHLKQEMKVRLTRVEKVSWRHSKSKAGSFDDLKDVPEDGAVSGMSDKEPVVKKDE